MKTMILHDVRIWHYDIKKCAMVLQNNYRELKTINVMKLKNFFFNHCFACVGGLSIECRCPIERL